ncbi:DNA-directed RNA polymerase subunit delta [Bacillus sp. AGMB 02131]|uniref:Probable DNA-directed RNA polymerase subunit delta n=1 Tax=Peribacillus faecalis TaxID=2772559 RepID=A0A927CSH8_9BACI|nr:DNA-directed RNA polymerase subunit delta [Peribacillus faecalis]
MSLNQYTQEEIKEMSLIEVAYEIMQENHSKQAVAFGDLVQQIAQLQELSTIEVQQKIAQFYTDLNVDGRFNTVGENRWGLKDWYPIDQVEDELINPVKPKKKKGKKVVDEDFEDLDLDEIDEFDDTEEEELLVDEEDILDLDEDDDEDLDEDELIEDDFEIVDEEELDEEEEDELL